MKDNSEKKENSKTREELELELLSLRSQLMNQVIAEKKKPKTSKIKSWSPVILTFVSIAAGLFGILFPSIKYMKQQNEQYRFNMNKDMVTFVNNLYKGTMLEQQHAAMMLTYYEKDAMPVLLHRLGEVHYDERKMICDAIKESIRNVSAAERKEMEEMLLLKATNYYQDYYIQKMEEDNKLYGMLNYIFTIGEIGETKKIHFINFLKEIENTLEQSDLDATTKRLIIKEARSGKDKLQ